MKTKKKKTVKESARAIITADQLDDLRKNIDEVECNAALAREALDADSQIFSEDLESALEYMVGNAQNCRDILCELADAQIEIDEKEGV